MRNAEPKSEKIPERNPRRMPRDAGTKMRKKINVSVITTIPKLHDPFGESAWSMARRTNRLSGTFRRPITGHWYTRVGHQNDRREVAGHIPASHTGQLRVTKPTDIPVKLCSLRFSRINIALTWS
jgi:hypothetical protein